MESSEFKHVTWDATLSDYFSSDNRWQTKEDDGTANAIFGAAACHMKIQVYCTIVQVSLYRNAARHDFMRLWVRAENSEHTCEHLPPGRFETPDIIIAHKLYIFDSSRPASNLQMSRCLGRSWLSRSWYFLCTFILYKLCSILKVAATSRWWEVLNEVPCRRLCFLGLWLVPRSRRHQKTLGDMIHCIW
jgi:hypothetical protein